MINGLVHWIAQNFPNIYNLGWTGDTGWGTSVLQIIYMTFCRQSSAGSWASSSGSSWF